MHSVVHGEYVSSGESIMKSRVLTSTSKWSGMLEWSRNREQNIFVIWSAHARMLLGDKDTVCLAAFLFTRSLGQEHRNSVYVQSYYYNLHGRSYAPNRQVISAWERRNIDDFTLRISNFPRLIKIHLLSIFSHLHFIVSRINGTKCAYEQSRHSPSYSAMPFSMHIFAH